MRKKFLIMLSVILFLLFAPSPSYADDLNLCKVKAPDWQPVSVGFPVKPERLNSLTNPKILVIPFKLKDTPSYSFTARMKENYEDAAASISQLSDGKSKPQFIFSKMIETDISQSDIQLIRENGAAESQAKSETYSSYGFVRRVIAKHDPEINFKGYSGVILEGSMPDKAIAEAHTFLRNWDPFFRPIMTGEGEILNTVLMDSHWNASVIAHEVMHLYGLADLYGTRTGPGYLSMMATNDYTLLSYEKWVLGWLPDSNVRCYSNTPSNSISRITFDSSKDSELVVLRSNDGPTYYLETSKALGTKHLAFYSLQIEIRPPFTFYPDLRFANAGGGLPLRDYQVIGSQLVGPQFTVLVSDFGPNSLDVEVIPTQLKNSVAFNALVTKSDDTKIRRGSEIQSKQTPVATSSQESENKSKTTAGTSAASEKLGTGKTSAQKKITITCVKGKVTKKVTAVSPKCPSGYKIRK